MSADPFHPAVFPVPTGSSLDPPPTGPPLDREVEELKADPAAQWGFVDALGAIFVLFVGGLVFYLLLAPVLSKDLASSVGGLLGYGAAFAVAVFRPRRTRGGLRRALGYRLRLLDVPRAVGYLVALYLISSLVILGLRDLVPGLRGGQADNASFIGTVKPAAQAVLVLTAVGVAPFVEETVFRGVLLRGLMRRLPFWPAALLTTAIFAVLHAPGQVGSAAGAVLLVVSIGVLGLGLAVLARRTGRLFPGMIVHALFNLVAVLSVLGVL